MTWLQPGAWRWVLTCCLAPPLLHQEVPPGNPGWGPLFRGHRQVWNQASNKLLLLQASAPPSQGDSPKCLWGCGHGAESGPSLGSLPCSVALSGQSTDPPCSRRPGPAAAGQSGDRGRHAHLCRRSTRCGSTCPGRAAPRPCKHFHRCRTGWPCRAASPGGWGRPGAPTLSGEMSMLEGGRASPGEQTGRGARAQDPTPASTVPWGIGVQTHLLLGSQWELVRGHPVNRQRAVLSPPLCAHLQCWGAQYPPKGWLIPLLPGPSMTSAPQGLRTPLTPASSAPFCSQDTQSSTVCKYANQEGQGRREGPGDTCHASPDSLAYPHTRARTHTYTLQLNTSARPRRSHRGCKN